MCPHMAGIGLSDLADRDMLITNRIVSTVQEIKYAR